MGPNSVWPTIRELVAQESSTVLRAYVHANPHVSRISASPAGDRHISKQVFPDSELTARRFFPQPREARVKAAFGLIQRGRSSTLLAQSNLQILKLQNSPLEAVAIGSRPAMPVPAIGWRAGGLSA